MALVACVIAVVLFGQEARTTVRDQLSDEQALQQVLSRHFDPLPMSDLLAIISKETGVGISAGRSIKDQMVLLCVKEKSYAEVLRKIAEHFGCSWELQHVGKARHYMLSQPSSAAAEEARERDRLELERLEKVRTEVRQDGAVTDAEIAARKAALIQWYREEPKTATGDREQSGDWSNTAEARIHSEWRSRIESEDTIRLKPDRLAVARFLSALPESAWLRLARGETISFCTSPRPYQETLPASWIDSVRTWIAKASKSVRPDQDMQDSTRPFSQLSPEEKVDFHLTPQFDSLARGLEFVDALIAGVSLLVQLEEPTVPMFGAGIVPTLHVALVGFDSSRRPLRCAYYYFGQPLRYPGGTAPDSASKIEPPKDYSKDPILGRQVSVPRVISGIHVSDVRERKELVREYTREIHSKGPLAIPFAAIRRAVSDATGYALISDAYQPHAIEAFVRSLGHIIPTNPLAGQLLDLLKTESGQSWTIEDGWIEMRTKDWAYYRPRTLTHSAMMKLLGFMRGERPTLHELAEFAASLSPSQCLGLVALAPYNAFAGPVASDTLLHPANLRALRIWAGLSLAQRETLLSGGAVPLGVLAPAAKEAVTELLSRQPIGRFLYRDSWNQHAWRSATPGEQGAVFASPFDWTEFLPDSLDAPIYLTAKTDNIASYYCRMVSDTGEVATLLEPPPSAARQMLKQFSKESEPTSPIGMALRFGRLNVQTLALRVHLGRGYSVEAVARVAQSAPGDEFAPEALPEDAKRFIAETEPSE